MKRVLVITYYWPPAGGGGVQRWLKFAKYLPEFGWTPVIYAPDGADYPLVDPSLKDEIPHDLEVIKQPIVEPRRLYGAVASSSKRRSREADEIFHRDPHDRTWMQNIAVWMRGNLLIPDARVLWVRPSVRYLYDYLGTHPVDAIVTTGPPHSMHLIGRQLHLRLGIPWIADFRDPWTEIEFFGDMLLTSRSEAKHRMLEAAVLREADTVVTVSSTWAERLQPRAKRVITITNGFDADNFEHHADFDSSRFRITHVGSLSMDRNPNALWRVLADLLRDKPGLADAVQIEMVGRVDPGVAASMKEHGLKEYLNVRGYVSHGESIRAMCRAAIQLLLINRDAANAPGRIPGKLFEYLAAKRPILLIGPTDGDAARILKETGAGKAFDYDDVSGIRGALAGWFGRHCAGTLRSETADISRFSRRNQAGEYAELLSSLIENGTG